MEEPTTSKTECEPVAQSAFARSLARSPARSDDDAESAQGSEQPDGWQMEIRFFITEGKISDN